MKTFSLVGSSRFRKKFGFLFAYGVRKMTNNVKLLTSIFFTTFGDYILDQTEGLKITDCYQTHQVRLKTPKGSTATLKQIQLSCCHRLVFVFSVETRDDSFFRLCKIKCLWLKTQITLTAEE